VKLTDSTIRNLIFNYIADNETFFGILGVRCTTEELPSTSSLEGGLTRHVSVLFLEVSSGVLLAMGDKMQMSSSDSSSSLNRSNLVVLSAGDSLCCRRHGRLLRSILLVSLRDGCKKVAHFSSVELL